MRVKFAAVVAVFSPLIGWGQTTCDRACLENFVDQYMDALIAHNPKNLPLSARVKNTEDGVRLDPGDGFWRSANAKGSYRFFVTDTENGQVAFMGTMREDPNLPVIMGIRLKVENRQVTEIENLVVRDALAATNLEKRGKPDPIFLETIPAAQRASRAELVRLANIYLSALERNDGKINVPFAPDCERVQNGVQTTDNPNAIAQMTPPAAPGRGKQAPAPAVPQPPPPVNITDLGCAEQFKLGVFGWVRRVRDRRFVAVDRERGLAMVIAELDEPAGKYATYKLTDGRSMTFGPDHPTTIAAFEAYKIDRGKLRRIEAIQHDVPYGMLSGWSSYEDGMSSRPR